MRVAGDRGDEWRAKTVDRERAGDFERFARCDVGVDLSIRNVGGEGDAGGGDRPDRTPDNPAPVVDDPVPGVQVSGAATLQHPAFARNRSKMWLPVDDSVEFERGIPAEDEAVDGFAVDETTSDRRGLEPGEQLHQVEG